MSERIEDLILIRLIVLILVFFSVKVIVPTVVVQFLQSVTIQEIHTNKYKNTFHSQQIDQYMHSRNVFI